MMLTITFYRLCIKMELFNDAILLGPPCAAIPKEIESTYMHLQHGP